MSPPKEAFNWREAEAMVKNLSLEQRVLITLKALRDAYERLMRHQLDPKADAYEYRLECLANVISALREGIERVKVLSTDEEVQQKFDEVNAEVSNILGKFAMEFPRAPELPVLSSQDEQKVSELQVAKPRRPAPDVQGTADVRRTFTVNEAIRGCQTIELGFCGGMRDIFNTTLKQTKSDQRMIAGSSITAHVSTAIDAEYERHWELVAGSLQDFAAMLMEAKKPLNKIVASRRDREDATAHLQTFAWTTYELWASFVPKLELTKIDSSIHTVARTWWRKFSRVAEQPELLKGGEDETTPSPFGSASELAAL